MIHPKSIDAYNLLHEGTIALAHAEQAGFRVDTEYLEQKKVHLTRKINFYESRFRESTLFKHWEHHSKGKINIHSNAQLAHFLYKVKKLTPASQTESGQGATDEDALKQLGIPEIETLLHARKLRKVRDTFLEGFEREQVDGYVHPVFNLHLVRTFRSSSDSPNFQNIPKRDEEAMQICRQALYPRPGHQLLEIDYSGLEVAIAACYHMDPNMLKYIETDPGILHSEVAKEIYQLDKFDKTIAWHDYLRQSAKNGFVFPQFYGDYYLNCAKNIACGWGKLPQGKWSKGQGIALEAADITYGDLLLSKGFNSLDKFADHIKRIEKDFWGRRFPDYAKWKEIWYSLYKKYGYVDSKTSFRCSGVMGKNDVINYPIQGSAFHCLLWSFIQIDKLRIKEQWDSRLIGQIHDSIIMDVHPEELDYIKQIVTYVTTKALPKAWKWIVVPLRVGMEVCPVDASWAEKQKVR